MKNTTFTLEKLAPPKKAAPVRKAATKAAPARAKPVTGWGREALRLIEQLRREMA